MPRRIKILIVVPENDSTMEREISMLCPTLAAIPGARYVEIRTGHYMAVQTPDLIPDRIGEFLKSIDA
jgi:3-oxoadipate enol-lactonase